MGQTFTGSMIVDTWFLNPRLGVLHTFGSGLTVGADIGLHVPVSRSSSTQLSYPGVPIPETVTAVAELGSRGVLPTVTLLQLGFLF